MKSKGLEMSSSVNPKGSTGVLAQLTKQQKQRIEAEAKPLLKAAEKCKVLWNSLLKADFRNEGRLNEANMNLVFEQNKKMIEDLLKLAKVEDFIDVFDQNKDGYLDEDEQVLIFSVIKAKIQIIAETLCDIHNYAMYKQLMKEVREIEAQIVDYQDFFRKRIYKKQLEEYKTIGDQMTQEERDKWSKILKEYQMQLLKKVEMLQQKQQEDEETLKRALEHPSQSIKVKSIPKLKHLQYQEKLVAINERVEEAMNYRKELKVLEEENERKKKAVKEANDEKARQHLLEVRQRELNELNAKIRDNKRLLERTRELQMDVVSKKINLHVKDIERIQGLLRKHALKKALTEDELRRVHSKAKKTMKVMEQFKQINDAMGPTGRISPTRTLDDRSTLIHTSNPFIFTNKLQSFSGYSNMDTTAYNSTTFRNVIEPLKRLARSLAFTRFNIRSTVVDEEDKPINKAEDSSQSTWEKVIKDLLGQRKATNMGVASIAEMYDDDLNLIEPDA
eukprot:TRINITY_DN2480_c0_g1_i1.p1 TRINITY_DN2480_c0_g1~~TRINITY_DN2480_c0_g1_i1.p1  ORF type:complete len:504 (+),score=183.56 TRINITY_DN2480_c0_g1_i1:72-1583(+)